MGSHIGAETNAAAWTFLDSVTVNVVSNTELTHIPIGGIPIPKDSTIGLYMQMQNPSSRVRYLWLSNPITRSNNEIEIFTGSGADHNFGGNYYPRDLNCRVYYHFGFKPEGDCASPRTLVEAIQSFKPAAGFSFQPNGTQVLFSNLSLGADSFYWDFGNGATSNLLNPFYDYGQDGTFTIQLIAKNECGADTATQDVTVMAVGVDELITQLHIWPNPASSILHIEIDQPGVVAQIHTNMGSLVLRSELSDKVHEIDVSNLPIGIVSVGTFARWSAHCSKKIPCDPLMDRYDVQHQLKDFGKDGQEILSSSSLVVVGAGGLGCPVLQSLAGMGVGKIHIIDQDTVELENLHRQHLYAESDVGEAKVDAAAKRLRAMNSEVQIRTSHDRLTQENAVDLLRGSEAIMDCTDNFSTRYIIDLFCAEYSVPMIYAGVRAYEGQVTVYNFNDGPSFHSIFPGSGRGDEK